ncbi:MAG: efflux RND transporter periplasmic adaptor subunit [Elusimicrobia bacterium]|nr:efflux RND transporter periplasmic adaptor subunit [Elusimicrobiota bacterium]
MNKNLLIAALAAALTIGGGIGTYVHFHGGHGAHAQAEVYYCPMHPDYTSDRPGDCPICGMHLVKRVKASEEQARTEPGVKFYRSPMNPSVTSKVPMKDEMGMDYVPVYEENGSGPEVAGHGTVKISPEKQQLIGLRTGKAAYRRLAKTVRASGKVAYDPELYRAITEYREALAAYAKIKNSTWPDAVERAKAVVESSKIKLRQMGFGDEHFPDIDKDPAHYENLLLPEDKVWVYAQVYEYESAAVKPGQDAAVTSRAYPGRTFRGVVRSLDPIFSEETRTLRARLEVENPGRELRSEMYVEAEIRADLGTVLAVPVSAVLNTGEKEIVFVMKGEGTFEPREIRTGRRNEDYAEVLSGLRAGESLVVSANFIVDSESRMRSALGD